MVRVPNGLVDRDRRREEPRREGARRELAGRQRPARRRADEDREASDARDVARSKSADGKQTVGRSRIHLLLALVAAAAPAAAQDVTSGDVGPKVEEMEMRSAFFDQTGHGYQSVAGPAQGPGKEDALIFEPLFHLKIRQDAHWTHTVDITVDIVSNASIDAIDAMSTASAVNEAATLDVSSAYKDGDHTLTARYGGHLEEPFRSVFVGGDWTVSLADDNAAIGVSGMATFDFFDHVDRLGSQLGLETRQTLNGNLSARQLLSPTTVVDATYGFTLQTGTLQTTYNSVPLAGGGRADEIFPGRRVRHAFAARIAQHIPLTRSTIKAAYRYYLDNYQLTAHTAEGMFYQYLTDWLYLRASYRYHWQSGVDFFADSFAPSAKPGPETSDSDLAPFTAHEIGLKLVLLAERSPWVGLKRSFIEASFYRYFRSNDLDVNWLAIAFGRRF